MKEMLYTDHSGLCAAGSVGRTESRCGGRRLLMLAAAAVLTLWCGAARAQHTLGVWGGYGMATCRFYPAQETRWVWGMFNGGVSWRNYTAQRFFGGFGIDLEYMQRGFSYVPYPSRYEYESEYEYYERRVNTLMLPIVWQPHLYVFNRHMRIFLEAAATFSYNLSSTYANYFAKGQGAEDYQGKYDYKYVRDNRWGYGLAGGGGFSLLFGQLEFGVRVRYYFGYSDLIRNRNRYYDNGLDSNENPFYYTPIRSPLDNLSISIGMAFRFGRAGFREWDVKPQKHGKRSDSFNYSLD